MKKTTVRFEHSGHKPKWKHQ